MRKIRAKLFNRLLALMGVGMFANACVMYATPVATYRISGSVKDEAGNPIEGISLRQYQAAGPNRDGSVIYDGWEGPELARTAADGTFSFSSNVTSFGGEEDDFIFRDIDGPENGGEFEALAVTIALERIKKGHGWNRGVYAAEEPVDVVMRLAQNEGSEDIGAE